MKRTVSASGLGYSTDVQLRERTGIVVALSERGGGVSAPPYDALNLAAHVGDDPRSVDENRSRLCDAIGISVLRGRIVTAEQVHGTRVHRVEEGDAGRGAYASHAPVPVPETDALMTDVPGIPLLMLYADCVPVILAAESPSRAIAVVHSGWKGTIGRIAARAVEGMRTAFGVNPGSLRAYIGPHIRNCCYEVGDEVVSQFVNEFDTITAVDGHVDLQAAVVETLVGAGVGREHIGAVDSCTRDRTDRYFSFRAHGVTGRHGALAVITKV